MRNNKTPPSRSCETTSLPGNSIHHMATYAIHFSPTGTTRFCLRTICLDLDERFSEISLNPSVARRKAYSFLPGDLVVIGFPVYGGRLPSLPESLTTYLQGNGANACCLVTYGNRAYEDALLELSDLCTASGFTVIAGGAFIGQHTFSPQIATNRPDIQDIRALLSFSAAIREKQKNGSSTVPLLPGNRPYREWNPMPVAPQPNENCIECGACAEACPVDAISREAHYIATDPIRCLDCYACVKACPTEGRSIIAPPFQKKIADLTAMLQGVRREPEWFL